MEGMFLHRDRNATTLIHATSEGSANLTDVRRLCASGREDEQGASDRSLLRVSFRMLSRLRFVIV